MHHSDQTFLRTETKELQLEISLGQLEISLGQPKYIGENFLLQCCSATRLNIDSLRSLNSLDRYTGTLPSIVKSQIQPSEVAMYARAGILFSSLFEPLHTTDIRHRSHWSVHFPNYKDEQGHALSWTGAMAWLYGQRSLWSIGSTSKTHKP